MELLYSFLVILGLGHIIGGQFSQQISDICTGTRYTLGCESGTGSEGYLNIRSIQAQFGTAQEATDCVTGSSLGPCSLALLQESDLPVGVENLKASILSKCTGRAQCTGLLPAWRDLPAPSNEQHFLCNGFDYEEFLISIGITATCDGDPQSTLTPPTTPSISTNSVESTTTTTTTGTTTTTIAETTTTTAATTTTTASAEETTLTKTETTTPDDYYTPTDIKTSGLTDAEQIYLIVGLVAGAIVILVILVVVVVVVRSRRRKNRQRTKVPMTDMDKFTPVPT